LIEGEGLASVFALAYPSRFALRRKEHPSFANLGMDWGTDAITCGLSDISSSWTNIPQWNDCG